MPTWLHIPGCLALGEWSHHSDYLHHEDLFCIVLLCILAHLFLISSASVRSIPFLSFIEPIFAWNATLVSLIFSKRSLVFLIQVYALTSNAEEAEFGQFYEDLQDLLELTPQKRCLFHYRGLECKSGDSRNTWSSRQIWPWSMEWSRAKANWGLPRECTAYSKDPLPTTQEKTLNMDITRWSTLKSDWLYSLPPTMEKFYTVSKNKTGIWLGHRSWTPYCWIQT